MAQNRLFSTRRALFWLGLVLIYLGLIANEWVLIGLFLVFEPKYQATVRIVDIVLVVVGLSLVVIAKQGWVNEAAPSSRPKQFNYKQIGLNLTLFSISLLVAFGAAELLSRALLPPPEIVTFRIKSQPQDQTETGLHRGTETGTRLRANMHITQVDPYTGRSIEIKTNSLGYRDKEIGPKQGPRILFLGDSITYGVHVNDEETFVRLVETRAKQNGLNWQTINTGVVGLSLANELAILKETGLSTKPNAVVLNFYLNDFRASSTAYVPRLPSPLNKSWLAYYTARTAYFGLTEYIWGRRVLASAYILNINNWKQDFEQNNEIGQGDYRYERTAFNSRISENFYDWGGTWSPEAWLYMDPLFEELKALSDRHDFELYIVMFPVSLQVEAEYVYDFPQQQLKQRAALFDIPVLDLLPILKNEYRASGDVEDFFLDHAHYTIRGNEIIGDAIYRFLTIHRAAFEQSASRSSDQELEWVQP